MDVTNTLWTESPLKRWREVREKEPEPLKDPDVPHFIMCVINMRFVTQRAENPGAREVQL